MNKKIEERHRSAGVMIQVNAYGTEEHLRNTVMKMFKELELQRFEMPKKRWWYDMDNPEGDIFNEDDTKSNE